MQSDFGFLIFWKKKGGEQEKFEKYCKRESWNFVNG